MDELDDGIAELIANGDYSALSDLLNNDPSIVQKRSDLNDAVIHWACHHKQVSLLGLILSYRPDVNAVGSNGWTPLHWAVEDGDSNSVLLVSMLLGAGADPTIRDESARTPAQLAKVEMTFGLKEVLALLG